MATHKTGRVRVLVKEYERGWGLRIEDTLYFDTREEAVAYCVNFNKNNTKTYVPDWYMVAEIE